VGAQGAGVNKLREQLGVKVDVTDDFDDKETVVGKKKKVDHQKSKVKVRRIRNASLIHFDNTVFPR
jgi:hypothetical protein